LAAKELSDIRMVERAQRKSMSSAGAPDTSNLPDLAANVAPAQKTSRSCARIS
jgi:hypothetical protein